MRPLGDLEAGEPPFEPGDLALDLPAAIEPLRRRFELTRLVSELADHIPGGLVSASAALDLADALGGFLDGLQIEEITVGDRLVGLVDARTGRALAGVTGVPGQGADPVAGAAGGPGGGRRQRAASAAVAAAGRALDRRTAQGGAGGRRLDRHRARPPGALLIAVAAAPKGSVVLPGLDQDLADKAWNKVDVQHPQGALKRLLEQAKLAKGDVAVWPASVRAETAGRWRRRIVNEALRPAEETADWLQVIAGLRERAARTASIRIAEGLKGLSLVSARTEEEAATVVALLLREALETPERTAALVTPDQVLARRVSAKLARWGVVPDSSAR